MEGESQLRSKSPALPSEFHNAYEKTVSYFSAIAGGVFGDSSHSITLQGGPKTDTQFNFWNNFGNSAPFLTILSLLQAEIYGA